ncbi:MAG: polysaccharide deacetylase family protein [Algoriphagus sp.]|uniref:polysaccharide deacetylase family protein n=1 Tax=Algoriphagus sp. TaxID=1872435 RepID=UPI002731513C|nr:polysaccharide deacetylase family protein [Algoriphagus sp.]MDP2042703.1 polysaccharide deacetylase family protein [Algoriphagus sp.]MDP3473240.1 polysaccharide deacetylase family protein [Algoriphagus sp.]
MKSILYLPLLGLIGLACTKTDPIVGQTEITKFQGNKKGAISVTYDDGIVNQFTIAKPIMDSLALPATFYIITGKVEGSGKGKFIGRDPKEIISETARIKTDSTNFFERASLIAFTGSSEAEDYHARAGSLFEQGKVAEAHALIDEGYTKIRRGTMKNTNDVVFHNNAEDTTTWEQYRSYSAQGHEIASHTVTHPRLAALDEVNMLYELEQSKADLLKFIGPESTFSAEGPYGTENERVMEFAHKVYPSLRNRMPEDWLEEINRGSKMTPGESTKEYVQWQRGPVTRIDITQMKAWVDTTMSHDNNWLVLVFHGIENLGWEPKTRSELVEYFSYMKTNEPNLWIATFRDVTKYLRERKATQVSTEVSKNAITVELSSSLDPETYSVPLTLKTYVPAGWTSVQLAQSQGNVNLEVQTDEKGSYVIYEVRPGSAKVSLKKGS